MALQPSGAAPLNKRTISEDGFVAHGITITVMGNHLYSLNMLGDGLIWLEMISHSEEVGAGLDHSDFRASGKAAKKEGRAFSALQMQQEDKPIDACMI